MATLDTYKGISKLCQILILVEKRTGKLWEIYTIYLSNVKGVLQTYIVRIYKDFKCNRTKPLFVLLVL